VKGGEEGGETLCRSRRTHLSPHLTSLVLSHLAVNEELSAQVEHLSLTLKTMTAQTVSGMPQ
jgi:hypothetical protein